MNQEFKLRLIPEWEQQDLVIIAWPHEETDWNNILDEAERCYLNLAKSILAFEDLLILSPNAEHIHKLFANESLTHKLSVMEVPTNDTWCRDYGALSFTIGVNGEERKLLADFTFNAWGMKFPADKDNLINRCLYLSYAFNKDVDFLNRKFLTLEGGSIESDGQGTIMTTYNCIFEPNRNPAFTEDDLRQTLKDVLGAERLIILDNGELEGDDTDGHIDTLARFISSDTIAYVACDDVQDSHYHSLKRMEAELQQLRQMNGEPYKLIPLPLPKAIYEEDGHRLPATYANFLFVNGGLLVPTYGQSSDDEVIAKLQEVLPERKVVGVDCRTLIRQHGSLHCATMQIPKGFINAQKFNS